MGCRQGLVTLERPREGATISWSWDWVVVGGRLPTNSLLGAAMGVAAGDRQWRRGMGKGVGNSNGDKLGRWRGDPKTQEFEAIWVRAKDLRKRREQS